MPDPARLFSGRLFAHLRARTAPARKLLARHAAALARLDSEDLLREAAAGIGVMPAATVAGLCRPDSSCSESSEDEQGCPPVAAAAASGDGAEQLPIHTQKAAIVAAVAAHAVTCIQGETGCGKSSMVPQFLVTAARARGERVRVIVTQPQRLAAITLAGHVARQLGGQPLGEVVGYRVGHGVRCDSSRCVVRFVTAGYLLQHLSHRPAHLSRYTHVVLDEVTRNPYSPSRISSLVSCQLDSFPRARFCLLRCQTPPPLPIRCTSAAWTWTCCCSSSAT